MNTLLRKEFRLLLPAWIATLAVATIPLWRWHNAEGLAVPLTGMAALFLALAPFGQEMNWGTFGLLLAQPERRERVWNIKAGLVAVALVSGWAVFAVCWSAGTRYRDGSFFDYFGSVPDTVVRGAFWTVAVFSGGLWATLLLRDVAAALFATCLVPVFIYGGTFLCLSGVTEWAECVAEMAVGVYAAVGVVVARRLFLRAQDLPWTGGQITLASGRAKPLAWLTFGFKERRGAWSALALKELQLQKIAIILVPILLFLHVAALAVRHFAPDWSRRIQYLDFVGFLWLIIPLVVGCVAVAEERRLNTWEGALCLPVSRRKQLAIKFAVVLFLGTMLGGVVPSAVEWLARAAHISSRWDLDTLRYMNEGAFEVVVVSFLASTMSRGMLQCFTVASLLSVSLLFLGAIFVRTLNSGIDVISWSGHLFPTLAWPAGIIIYIFLAARNCRQLRTGVRVWVGNFVCLAAVLGLTFLATDVIYQRAWELVLPVEAKHGPSRLAGPTRPKLAAAEWRGLIYALLPDGRLWCGHGEVKWVGFSKWDGLTGEFAEGTNWIDIASSGERNAHALAIKSDGTLWNFTDRSEAVQVGTDSNWKKIIASRDWYLGLKQDGSVWVLSTRLKSVMYEDEESKRANFTQRLELTQMGTNSNWADIHLDRGFWGGSGALLCSRDGLYWNWIPAAVAASTEYPSFSSPSLLWLIPDFDTNVPSTNWPVLATSEQSRIGVRSDGTLWSARSETRFNAIHVALKTVNDSLAHATNTRARSTIQAVIRGLPSAQPSQIGTNSDWVTVAGGTTCFFVALESNGTLWDLAGSWEKGRYLGEEEGDGFWGPKTVRYAIAGQFASVGSSILMTQPSKCRHWLAATSDGFTTWALGADGTLACWTDPFLEFPYDRTESDWIRLRPSRRPMATINIVDSK